MCIFGIIQSYCAPDISTFPQKKMSARKRHQNEHVWAFLKVSRSSALVCPGYISFQCADHSVNHAKYKVNSMFIRDLSNQASLASIDDDLPFIHKTLLTLQMSEVHLFVFPMCWAPCKVFQEVNACSLLIAARPKS